MVIKTGYFNVSPVILAAYSRRCNEIAMSKNPSHLFAPRFSGLTKR
jgi:hypothetical protein